MIMICGSRMAANCVLGIVGVVCMAGRVARADELVERPRVIVTTDISDGLGDPDDRQSLCHLLWYSDVLDIRGIVADRFDNRGSLACAIVFDLYEKDYSDARTRFAEEAYPTPQDLRDRVFCRTLDSAKARILEEAHREGAGPLWILAWGNLCTLEMALQEDPTISSRIRLISIGTHLKTAQDGGDGRAGNWNSPCRQGIYDRFPLLWWLESDWTYNGMFPGKESVELKEALAREAGALGQHIKEVIGTVDWADNFRAGDTPSVLYLIDGGHDQEDPTVSSWAGRYYRPFPETRPLYWTDIPGGVDWDYSDPVRTWAVAKTRSEACAATLLERRPEMYKALLSKVRELYGRPRE